MKLLFLKNPLNPSKSWFRNFLIIFLIAAIPAQAFAWGANGHRIVGAIAESHLTAKAKAAIKQILGPESLAMASTWADFVRSDTAYKYLDTWHYINFEGGMNKEQLLEYLKTDTSTNIYTRSRFIINELKTNKTLSREQKIFYLRLLVHFIGDMHQPLHVSRTGDRGGNDIKVRWFREESNLHRVWDDHLVTFQNLSYTEHVAFINHTTWPLRRLWQRQPMEEWVYESYSISESLREDIKETNQRLGYEYNYKYVGIMNEQLLKGGIRLAGILNEIFG